MTATKMDLRQIKASTQVDSTSTGATATLQAFTAGRISITNASLTSIAGVPAGIDGQIVLLENDTGNNVTILNDDAGATATNRIYTGTNSSITLTNKASVFLTYSTTNSRWMMTGGSGGSNSTTGVTGSTALGSGVSSGTITFGTAQANTSYVLLVQLVNLTDTNPEFQTVVVTNKTTAGFSWKMNSPTDTTNYLIEYKILYSNTNVGFQVGEQALSSGVTSATITLPVTLPTSTYVVVAEMTNYVDTNPAFQPLVVTAKTTGSFTVKWNSPTDTVNYNIAFNIN